MIGILKNHSYRFHLFSFRKFMNFVHLIREEIQILERNKAHLPRQIYTRQLFAINR